MNISSARRSPLAARAGFTLIEILIVVTIIGLLASVVLVGLAPARKRGNDARRIADLKEVQNALEIYYNKCGHYPGDETCAAPQAGTAVPWNNLKDVLLKAGIGVNQVPDDPTNGRTYQYATNDGGTGYVLAATFEDASNPALTKEKNNFTMPDGIPALDGACGTDIYCVAF